MRKVKKVLKEIGFVEKNKYFQRPDCPWFIEFVSPPIAVGSEPIHKFYALTTPFGTIQTLMQPIVSKID